ncbi:MAG: T9SS type A sorting domain-containing protein [Bacteroidota bacterium]
MKQSLLFLFLLFISTSLIAQQWKIDSVGFGGKPSIVVDGQDRPHIAFMLEETSQNGFIKHAVLENGTFQETFIDNAYFYGPLAIAADANGFPAIAVHHHDTENEYVYRWDGVLWEGLVVESEGHDGWDNSITFDNNNNIHTSSIDPFQFGSDEGVEYAFYDGNQWTKESILAGPTNYEFSTCIQVDSDNVPHIVFYDSVSDNLIYANKKTGEWRNFIAANKGGMFASLILDENNLPHITYYEQVSNEQGKVHYIRLEGDEWKSEVVDELFNAPIAFTGSRNLTSLAKDATGKLHLCYGDRKVMKYATLEEEGWQIDTWLDYTESDIRLGAQTSLAVDSKGQPHITYFELLSTSPVSGNVMYATKPLVSNTQQIVKPEFDFTIHPNPASETISIEFDLKNMSQDAQLQLFDLQGKLLRSVDLEQQSTTLNWSISELSDGVYFIRLSTSNQLVTRELVVDK